MECKYIASSPSRQNKYPAVFIQQGIDLKSLSDRVLAFLFYQFRINMQLHLIGYNNAAGFSYSTPCKTVILAVDFTGYLKAGNGAAIKIFLYSTKVYNQLNRFRCTLDSQVAFNKIITAFFTDRSRYKLQ